MAKDLPVEEIRRLYATGYYTQKRLAEMFDTHQPYISIICSGVKKGSTRVSLRKEHP